MPQPQIRGFRGCGRPLEFGSNKPKRDERKRRDSNPTPPDDRPDQVYVQVEFASSEDAKEGAKKLIASGVLDRLPDHTGPTVVEGAESVVY
jgi:hypothetical protein